MTKFEKDNLPQIGAIYKHFKGGLYEILHNGYSSEDVSLQVIYQCVCTKEVWVRPLTEFLDILEDGRQRFTIVF
jgi:hypothetical protein